MDKVISPYIEDGVVKGFWIAANWWNLSFDRPQEPGALAELAERMWFKESDRIVCYSDNPGQDLLKEAKKQLYGHRLFIRNAETLELLEKWLQCPPKCRLIGICRNISLLDELPDPKIVEGSQKALASFLPWYKETNSVLNFGCGREAFFKDVLAYVLLLECKNLRRAQFSSDYSDRYSFLYENRIRSLYHVTAEANIESIYDRGGLFSWQYLRSMGILYKGGGGADSRRLDERYKLEDYVRLTFCRYHPMVNRLLRESREKYVVLKINPEVLLYQESCFTDMNAVKNGHTLSDDIEIVDMETIRTNNENHPHYQAEALVRRHIPIEYVTGITRFV